MKILSLVTASALAAGALGTACACEARDWTRDDATTRVAVTFRTADLTDPARTPDVRARLFAAVQRACQSEGEGPKWREADDRACEAEAMRDAEQRLRAARPDVRPAATVITVEPASGRGRTRRRSPGRPP